MQAVRKIERLWPTKLEKLEAERQKAKTLQRIVAHIDR